MSLWRFPAVCRSIPFATVLSMIGMPMAAQSMACECTRLLGNRQPQQITSLATLRTVPKIDQLLVQSLSGAPRPVGSPSEVSLLDSLWNIDSTAVLHSLAALITDPHRFGILVADRAAEEYRRLGGPADLVLWAMDIPSLDARRTEILAALPRPLAPSEQRFLLRQACATAVAVAAVTPHLAAIRRTGAQVAPPLWYESAIWELSHIRDALTGESASDFARLFGPQLDEAEAAELRWLSQ